MFYVKNTFGDWLLHPSGWYRGRPTFTNVQANAQQFTEAEADLHLAHPNMHPGAYKEPVPA